MLSERKSKELRYLNEKLLLPVTIDLKLKYITASLLRIFDADFAGIWILRSGDLCDKGCIYARAGGDRDACFYREKCLHLVAGSGRYTHIDGEGHQRVPVGFFKIGRIASGEMPMFVTNDVTRDPQVYDHKWAEELGLVSFAGYRLLSREAKPLGVIALFSKHAISEEDSALIESVAAGTSLVLQYMMIDEDMRKLSHAVEQTSCTILITDTKGRIEYVNSKFSQLTGYSREEVVGRMPGFLKSGQTPSDIYRELWKTIKSGHEWSGDFCNKRKDGELYWEYVFITPVRNDRGDITHFISIGEDITERKRMEEALIEARNMADAANRAKSEFLANISHELKTPLTAIIGFSELLADQSFGEVNKRQKEYLDIIYRSGRKLLGMINRIVDFSRVDAGNIKLEPETLLIPVVLEDSVEALKSSALKKNIEINMCTYESQLALKIGKSGLREIISILLENAIKFTPELGKIRLEAKRDEQNLRVIVTDTGIGIRPEDRKLVFKVFEQVDGSYRRRFGGTGIGLALAEKLVQLCGGTIWVESPPHKSMAIEAGKGSSFIFTIPCE